MARQTVDGVGVTTSETYYPLPPIEFGRAGGTVASVTRVRAVLDILQVLLLQRMIIRTVVAVPLLSL